MPVRAAGNMATRAVMLQSLPEPNIDFAVANLARVTGMVPGAGEAVFAVARTAGWIAHASRPTQAAVRYVPALSAPARNRTAIGDSRPGGAGLPPVTPAPPAACVPPAATDGPGILLRLWYSRAHSRARIAAAHYRCSTAGHQAGIDRGSPNHGS